MSWALAGLGAAMTAWSVFLAVEASRREVGRRRVLSLFEPHASRPWTSAISRHTISRRSDSRRVAVWSRGRARRRRHEREVLIDLLDDLAVAVSAGASLGPSLVDAGTSAAAHPSTRNLGVDLLNGTPVDRAVDRWCGAFAVADARTVSTVLVALVDGGADASGPIERLCEVVRQQVELDDEIRSEAAPAMASALTLSALPVLGVTAIAAIEPDTARWLLGAPAGLMLVAVSVGWNALGWAWMRHTTASVSS